MRVLLIHKAKSKLGGSLLLRMLCDNIKNLILPKKIQFDLIQLGVEINQNVFLKINDFNRIFFAPNFIDLLKNRKKFRYNLIINLDNSLYSFFCYWVLYSDRKIKISRKKFKNINDADDSEREKITAESVLKQINNDNFYQIKFPSLNVEEIKLLNTKKIINWILESSGQKKLEFLNFIFIYFRIDNPISQIKKVNNLIEEILRNTNHKVILMIDNSEKEIIKLVQKKIKNNKNIILNFLASNDIYYSLKFCQKSKTTITNIGYMCVICDVIGCNYIFPKENELTNKNISFISEHINYYSEKVFKS